MLPIPMIFYGPPALAVVSTMPALESVHDGDDGLWRASIDGQYDRFEIVFVWELLDIYVNLLTDVYGGAMLSLQMLGNCARRYGPTTPIT
jgi:hypothetical protein